MATHTAQILVGNPHPNHGGINPRHYLFLSENSRPHWKLVNENISPHSKGHVKTIWIPTLEHMLEDAFLMIAIYALEDEKVVELAKELIPKIFDRTYIRKSIGPAGPGPILTLYDDLEEEQRNQLYAECKLIKNFPKIIVSIFKGSSIENQLSILDEYAMDVEVCSNTYSRLYSRWTQEVTTTGALAIE